MADDLARQLKLAKAEKLRRSLSAGPAAQPSSFDPSMMQLEASAAFDETQKRRMDAMSAPPPDAWGGQGGPQASMTPTPTSTAPRPMTPTSAAPSAPGIPSPVGMPRRLGDYLSETGKNIPSSVGAMGRDMWHAATNPIETAKGLGGAVVGGVQLGKDALGIPSMDTFGDQRESGRAAGEYFQRYHPDNLTDTFRRDPAGVAVDALGALSGAGGAARGAMRMAPHMKGQDLMPPPQGAPQAAPTRMTREQFVEGAPSTAELKKAGSALYEAADRSGVRFASAEYGPLHRQVKREATARRRRPGFASQDQPRPPVDEPDGRPEPEPPRSNGPPKAVLWCVEEFGPGRSAARIDRHRKVGPIRRVRRRCYRWRAARCEIPMGEDEEERDHRRCD